MATVPQSSSGAAADESFVLIERKGPLAYLRLNRAAKRNVLSTAMVSALQAALDALASDRDVRVVILAAEGPAFSAGHDLTELGPDLGVDAMRGIFEACSQLMLTIQRVPQPVIARVHGIATAAGCQLVAMCDLAVASTNARFAVSGINVGLFCSTPAVALSRNILPKQALEMLLTGDFIDAETARERGLVNRVVPQEALDGEVEKLALAIATKSPTAICAGKRLFYGQRELSIEAAYVRAAEVMAENAVTKDVQQRIDEFRRRKG